MALLHAKGMSLHLKCISILYNTILMKSSKLIIVVRLMKIAIKFTLLHKLY